MKKLNYDFKVRDINKTRANHAKRIEKFEAYCKNMLYDYPLDLNKENALYQAGQFINNLSSWEYGYLTDKPAGQAALKELKTRINWYFRSEINSWLEYYDLPVSWATAVYLSKYDKFNKFMAMVAKHVYMHFH